eukprot:CAMPEP_0113311372 /NCGR_PEP_ID=MMETSP0010_2-20120614/8637_1 /TAXON_ID=216773 ORGANISM="Corethron hystrix, Strain 308" /NCGR_SAMPLE_ID=MMETSP0010_2 /ASSEMBLY_ACC=CAM_ASM_000155 /LENGTH=420 /DNA_ID=CAMNT_0000167001 /DNA_START=279 /DNA_END=1541 /DNA_ORIENTATION=- /assembly_acc=CAM_ASM_000155
MSMCMDIDMETDISAPSFDYEYVLRDITNTETLTSDETIKGTKTYDDAVTRVETSERTTNTNKTTERRTILSLMIVDKYYISADETHISLAGDTLSLLDSGHFLQFFQACGPTYIRSIRRASEFSGFFSYTDTTLDTTTTVNYINQLGSSTTSDTSVVEDIDMNERKCTIEIHVYGITLKGNRAFVARTFTQYKTVMETAFDAMMNPAVGFVKSIEAVPWVANVQFQTAIRMDTAVTISTQETVHPFLRRFYTIVNAEHMARLDGIIQHRLKMLNLLISCLGAASGFSKLENPKKLQNKNALCMDEDCNTSITLYDLKHTLLGEDTSQSGAKRYLPGRTADQLRTYIDHYVSPCMDDLSREAYGIPGGNMQMRHWTTMDGCKEASCVFAGTLWEGDKCVAINVNDNKDYVMDQYCNPTFI